MKYIYNPPHPHPSPQLSKYYCFHHCQDTLSVTQEIIEAEDRWRGAEALVQKWATPDKCKSSAEVLSRMLSRPCWNKAFRMPSTSESLKINRTCSFKCTKAVNTYHGNVHIFENARVEEKICKSATQVAIKRSFTQLAPILFKSRGWKWESKRRRGNRVDRVERKEQGGGLDVSSNQKEPAGGTERVGGVREEHH